MLTAEPIELSFLEKLHISPRLVTKLSYRVVLDYLTTPSPHFDKIGTTVIFYVLHKGFWLFYI